jgi:hypothetical protein
LKQPDGDEREMSVKATEKREEREFFLFSAEKAMNKGHV